MNYFTTAAAVLLGTTTMAAAGGIDRSVQPVGLLFEDGNRAELSFGFVMPSVDGTFTVPAGPAAGAQFSSGSAAPEYSTVGGGFKFDYSDRLSAAAIFDQPFGADVDYSDADVGYPLANPLTGRATNVELDSNAITVLGRYKFNDSFSVHGGLRAVQASGIYNPITFDGTNGTEYRSEYSEDTGFGYVIGGAYERPDIALRVALTYASAIDYELDGSVGDLDARTPQSVNLDFQTGIAADTLLFGSIRYAEWSEGYLRDSFIAANDPSNPTGDLVDWEDSVTYSIGVGRRFSDVLSGSLSVGYEAPTDEPVSNLSPTDGSTSVSIGAAYQATDQIEISGGVRYIWLGDATTETIAAEFEDNTAIAVGMSVGYSF